MFRTAIQLSPRSQTISLLDKLLTIGSCFSDNMGQRFGENKFEVLTNPFGTTYNPISIFKLLRYAINNTLPDESGYNLSNDLHVHDDFHSSFSNSNQAILKMNIDKAVERTNLHLQKTNWLIITFGTAFVYTRVDNKAVVSNCHKLPAKLFEKSLLTQKQILNAFDEIYNALKTTNPALKVLLTVSPVRHIKDTMELNSVSKATLRLACHTITQQHEDVVYFPSYEIMMDDLRDYRFYKADMLHPTTVAEDYIWQKFAETYFDDGTQNFLAEWGKIRAAIDHKPFNPASPQHQDFIKKTIKKIEGLEPQLDFSIELAQLRQQLID